jgi:DNA polymerase-4
MNNFYASVECIYNPSLSGKAMVVGGREEERRGIVLAKSEQAKKLGIKTGMTLLEAKTLCPNLIVVPPRFNRYLEFSQFAREIYDRYTDRVEPFGLDECWLDISTRYGKWEDCVKVAQEISNAIKTELGLTVSIGVSFNKVFAKLGSDLKKPDAITVIPKSQYKEIVWSLPVENLLGVGRSTSAILKKVNIRTIGDLANTNSDWLKYKLKSRGLELKAFANGQDNSVVRRSDCSMPAKSIGHGTTTAKDLESSEQVWAVILGLTQDVGYRLHLYNQSAKGVSIVIKNNAMTTKQWQAKLVQPTQDAYTIAIKAYELFLREYDWHSLIRAVTVTAIDLQPNNMPVQLDMFGDMDNDKVAKEKRVDDVIFKLRKKYGHNVIKPLLLVGKDKIKIDSVINVLPSGLSTVKKSDKTSNE